MSSKESFKGVRYISTILKRMLLFLFAMLLGIIFSFIINLLIIDKLVIGDPCRFHNKDIETGKVFDFFYVMNSSTGFHPEPSINYFMLLLIAGIVIGIVAYLKFQSRFIK